MFSRLQNARVYRRSAMTRFNTSFILLVLIGSICFQSGESIFPDLLENVLRYKCETYCVNLNSWTFIRNKLCPKFCPQLSPTTTTMPESTMVTTSTAKTTSTMAISPPTATTLASSASPTVAATTTPSSTGMLSTTSMTAMDAGLPSTATTEIMVTDNTMMG